MPNLLIYSPGQDTGGLGIAMKRAFDKHAPEWQARHIRREDNYLHYPADIEWTGRPRHAKLFSRADVIHVMEYPDAVAGYWHKVVVVQHLGSVFRRDPAAMSRYCKELGFKEVAGSIDLLLSPDLELLPILADLDAFVALRGSYEPTSRVRIGHAPTDRAGKSTAAIIGAVERLSQKYPVDFDLIEGVSWSECLARKAALDIFVDETTLGYGSNAMECWAMGIPVVSGIADPRHRALMEQTFGGLPFMQATEDTLYDVLEALVADASLRASWGVRGKQHAYAFHSEQAVVAQAIDLYRRAASEKGVTL